MQLRGSWWREVTALLLRYQALLPCDLQLLVPCAPQFSASLALSTLPQWPVHNLLHTECCLHFVGGGGRPSGSCSK